MLERPTGTLVAVFVVALCCGAQPSAQEEGPRPGYPAVFGGAVVDPTAREWVDFSLTAAQAYDDNLVSDVIGVVPSATQLGGWYTALIPRITAGSRGGRVEFSVNGGTNLRYYSGLLETTVMSHDVAGGISVRLNPSTSVFANEAVAYAPAYLYGLFPRNVIQNLGVGIPASADYQIDAERSYSSMTTAGLTHSLSSRAVLSVTGSVRSTNFSGGVPGYFDMGGTDIGGRWTYALNQTAKLRLGYTYRRVQYTDTLRPIEHDIEIGIDYTRPLSRTRKSTIGFSVGPTLVRGSLGGNPTEPADAPYRLIGNAFFEHQMGRSWYARGEYRRGLDYVQGLTAPVYTDGATAEAGGFLNRRVDVLFSGGYAQGNMVGRRTAAPAPFTTLTGDVRLRVGLSHQWAAFVEGLLYNYSFDQALISAPGLPRHFRRMGIRSGLTLWLPKKLQ